MAAGLDAKDGLRKTASARRQVNDVQYVSSADALEMLGIRRESFYTYVSRGLIKSRRKEGSKAKLYRKADVEKLRTRAGARAGAPAVSQALRYGEPLVQTWISEVTPRGPRYRGQLAADLVREGRSFEYVSELIWGGLPKSHDEPWGANMDGAIRRTVVSTANAARKTPVGMFAQMALALSSVERAGVDRDLPDSAGAAKTLIQAFVGASAHFGPSGKYLSHGDAGWLADHLSEALAPQGKNHAAILNAALVLSAEHELSAPTFAVRICASTGADIYACVAAGIMAQSGPMQVGGSIDAENLMRAVAQGKETPRSAFATGPLPCFGHPLYDRDPRASQLLEMLRESKPQTPGAARVWGLIDDAAAEDQYPNIFAALAAVTVNLGLPEGSAALLHTLGRTAGWAAHAIEQRLSGTMLRPRARYMGTSTLAAAR